MLILPLSTPSSGGLPPGVTSPGDGALNYVTGALTASRPSINVAQTWNNAAVPFDADLMDITDTASAAGSTLLNRRIGGESALFATKAGNLGFGRGNSRVLFDTASQAYAMFIRFNGASANFSLFDAGAFVLNGGNVLSSYLGLGPGSGDVRAYRGGNGIWEQRNAANAQTYRLERAYTDPSSRGYTDFAQDATGGLRINSVWTGGVAAPTNLLDVQGNGTSALVLQSIFGGAVSRLQKTASEPGALEFEGGNGQIYYNKSGIRSFGLGQDETRVRDLSGLTFGTDGRPGQGSITARFISPSSGLIEINNGTAGQFRDLRLRNVITPGGTAASLVAATTAGQGARSFVTDATASTFGTIVAGGGSNKVPVWSDGVNWLIG